MPPGIRLIGSFVGADAARPRMSDVPDLRYRSGAVPGCWLVLGVEDGEDDGEGRGVDCWLDREVESLPWSLAIARAASSSLGKKSLSSIAPLRGGICLCDHSWVVVFV